MGAASPGDRQGPPREGRALFSLDGKIYRCYTRFMTCGIYSILHIDSGRRYIGHAQNIEKRWNGHRTDLRRKCHHNKYLQRCWYQYGQEAFWWAILCECKIDELSDRELEYMQKFDRKKLFNAADDTRVSFRGMRHSQETREILREKALSRGSLAPEVCLRMRESQRRRFQSAEAHRARSDAAKRGYMKPGAIEKHRERQKRVCATEEARKNNSEAQKKHYAEHPERKKLAGERSKKRFSNIDYRVEFSRRKGGRPIIGISIETGEVKKYAYTDLVKVDGFDPENVRKVLKGKARHHKWHLWKYDG